MLGVLLFFSLCGSVLLVFGSDETDEEINNKKRCRLMLFFYFAVSMIFFLCWFRLVCLTLSAGVFSVSSSVSIVCLLPGCFGLICWRQFLQYSPPFIPNDVLISENVNVDVSMFGGADTRSISKRNAYTFRSLSICVRVAACVCRV